MEFDFDKEIDALLRQAAQGETASGDSKFKIQNSNLPHLDADEISLFAENALPAKMRQNAVAHFGDCDRCRGILSDLIAQNPEDKIVSAKQTAVFTPAIPWYRKIFAFPNLAYTMGALVVVFSGLVAFTLLHSVKESKNSEVSQVSERPMGGKGMSSDGETLTVEKQNSESTASTSMSNASSMPNSTSGSSSNAMMSNASMNSAARSSNASSASNTSVSANKPGVSEDDSPKEQSRQEVVSGNVVTELPVQGRAVKNLTEEKRERDKSEDKKGAETADMIKPAPAPKPEQPAVLDNEVTLSDAPKAKSRKLSRTLSVETTNIGGKTFQRQNNVWVDSAYKGQATINITRGTSEFKKLDSGLRGIAENLGGTVIIVWKDKAYRIQ